MVNKKKFSFLIKTKHSLDILENIIKKEEMYFLYLAINEITQIFRFFWINGT